MSRPLLSLSARRAWIEILSLLIFVFWTAVALRKESVDRNKYVVQCRKMLGVSLSARRAWIEICWSSPNIPAGKRSLSARRAWIEIKVRYPWTPLTSVALRKESVDRNRGGDTHANRYYVALRKESVDRNRRQSALWLVAWQSLSARRAWIEIWGNYIVIKMSESLSARRAWIEITRIPTPLQGRGVSLSARRAWIEIASGTLSDTSDVVALRKESVDRNRLSGYLVGVYPVALRKESVDRNTLNTLAYVS